MGKMEILCVLMASVMLLHLAAADLSATVATYSPACQMVLKYNASEVINTETACTLEAILTGIEAEIRIGFCTENEYANLSSTVCDLPIKDYPSSDAKINFYASLNKVSSNCQRKSYECIYSSVVAIVSKQQERYCSLMNLNINSLTSEICLTTGDTKCTQDEFQQLKTAACQVNTTATDQVFSTALLSTTATCQSQISRCADNSSEAWIYVWSEKYCDAMYIGGDKPTEACLRENNACTAAEFSALKVAACGPETTVTVLTTTASPTATSTATPLANQTITTPSDFALSTSGSIMVILLSCLLSSLSQ